MPDHNGKRSDPNRDEKNAAPSSAETPASKETPTQADPAKPANEQNKNIPIEHTTPHSKLSLDGNAEIVGPMIVDAFRKTETYTTMDEAKRKALDEQLEAGAKAYGDNFRVVVQNKIDGDETISNRIHLGKYDNKSKINDRSDNIIVTSSFNIANGKTSALEDYTLYLPLSYGNKLPDNRAVDFFIENVTGKILNKELSQANPANVDAFVAALMNGHSGKHQYGNDAGLTPPKTVIDPKILAAAKNKEGGLG